MQFYQSLTNTQYFFFNAGKWFNYGIIFLVLILDLNMWKNQIFYKPHEYGQYIGPGQKIYTVKDLEPKGFEQNQAVLGMANQPQCQPRLIKLMLRETCSSTAGSGASLDVKCLAFGSKFNSFCVVWILHLVLGRFLKNEQGMENQDKTYTRMRRKSPSEHSKDMGITREKHPGLGGRPTE